MASDSREVLWAEVRAHVPPPTYWVTLHKACQLWASAFPSVKWLIKFRRSLRSLLALDILGFVLVFLLFCESSRPTSPWEQVPWFMKVHGFEDLGANENRISEPISHNVAHLSAIEFCAHL